MPQCKSVSTPWQKARVRAAILGRYGWGNSAMVVEAATWILMFLAGAALASTEDAGHLAVRLGMAVTMLAGLLTLDTIRYHWHEAVMKDLHAVDQAIQHIRQAGEQPAAR